MNTEPSRLSGEDELIVSLTENSLQKNNITHIVSVLKYDFKNFNIDWNKYKHLQIEVDDVEDENLLAEFETTGAWIEEALKGNGRLEGDEGEKKKGAVLVHCAMGRSRSVTILIAYLLRQYSSLTPHTALAQIQQTRPFAEPNDGFMAQLQLYHEMGCPRNIDDQPKYQRWLYQREVELAVATGGRPDWVRFEDEEEQDKQKADGKEKEIRCRMCRRNLVTTPYLIPHTPSPKSTSSPTSLTTPISSLASTPHHSTCTHHFLHPLSWMRPELELGNLSGRLECPNQKCKAQVGKYAWQGMRCSCGVWVCPAFSLLKGRCDEVTIGKRVEGGSGGIRMPPGMRGSGTTLEREKGSL
ncbi:putative dual specificity protein [Botrytis fragariae]|uniref:protein-tyrosine-phosphatase n=1 Tax=Botrytis fragariae TaxID=1964551 RepID=A0A8H6ALA5_9HELO|nr:putative dual specificity protein [Botrytis fragariae]KAF5869360.1 putative dual specificity protein [Botrytis fragariae]